MAAVGLDFVNGSYQCGFSNFPSWSAFLSGSGATFARSSAQNYASANGHVDSFSTDVAAIGDKGLRYEAAGTNSIRNSNMTGVVAGTPGTLPTNWTTSLGTLTQTLATGTDATTGLPYVDVTLSGTTSTTSTAINFESGTAITAANNEVWTVSAWLALTAGSLTNISQIQVRQTERTTGGTIVLTDQGSDVKASLTSTPQRLSTTITLSGGATVARIQPLIALTHSSGVAINITLRIIAPQMEKASSTSSYITTSSAAASRAVTALTVPLPVGNWNITATFDDNSTQALNGVSGSYAVPILNRQYVKSLVGVSV